MTVGDKSAQSYGWSAKLETAVAVGESVMIPAPGFDEQYTDTRYAEASLDTAGGKVWRTGEGVTITFVTSEPYSVTVVNDTDVEWPIGASLYVFCPHLLAEGHNQFDLKGQIWDLQQRVSALEGATMQQTQRHAPAKEPEVKENHPKAASAHPPAASAHPSAAKPLPGKK